MFDLNGLDLAPSSVDAAYDLVIAAATGNVGLDDLAAMLAGWAAPFDETPPGPTSR